MMDWAQIATAAGTFIGAMVAAFFSRKSKAAAEKVRTEVEGPGDEPSLRQILVDHTKTTAAQFERIHRESGAVAHRIDKLETAVGKLESAKRGKA
jgi:uncharacterized membrane-anchored protein YhcB (DUF1043 family)